MRAKKILIIALLIGISLISMGFILPVKDGFEYQRIPGADDSWNEVEIMGYFGDEVDLVIPSEIEGMPVTRIGNFAFAYNGYREFPFKTVTIPDTVTRIGDGAFAYNYKITKVIMGNNVEYIGDYAFFFNQITEINIPNKTTYIGDSAFSHNRLSSVEIPKNIKYLGRFAFNDNQLTEIIIPKKISRIENSAFSGNKLTEVIIPDNITSIGNAAFYGNELSSITIPNSVTSIESLAFAHNKIKTAFIPSSVISIENEVFSSNQPNSWDLTIYGVLNSMAHIYAKENHYNFVERNDNLDNIREMEAKTQVSLDKSWDISFNLPINMNTINEENIYIVDKNNNIFPTTVLETEDDSMIKLIPLKEYTPGETYTIWIKDVKSRDDRVLKQRTKMDFTIVEF